MINDLLEIDVKNEEILKLILDKFRNFNAFFKNIKEHFITEELLYDNISVNNNDFGDYFDSISKIIEDYFYNPYDIEINKDLLLNFNELINKEDGFRDKNIIHRHFLHEISDYKSINIEVDNLFSRFENTEFTTLENYAFITYQLFQVYPFLNSLSIRILGNIYLLKNDYLPFILSNNFKSEYYYMFQYDFPRFKDAFFKLMLRSFDLVAKRLGSI